MIFQYCFFFSKKGYCLYNTITSNERYDFSNVQLPGKSMTLDEQCKLEIPTVNSRSCFVSHIHSSFKNINK